MKHIKVFESFGIGYKVIAVALETHEAVGVFPSYRELEDSSSRKGASMLSRFGEVEGAEDIYDRLIPKGDSRTSNHFVFPMIDLPDDHDIIVTAIINDVPTLSTMSSKDLKEPVVGDSRTYEWPDDPERKVYYRAERDLGRFTVLGGFGDIIRMSSDDLVDLYLYKINL